MTDIFALEQYKGLTEEEAALKHKAEGPNEISSEEKRGIARIILDVLREPMILLLLAGACIYLFLGEVTDTIMMFAMIVFIICLTLYQEGKTERALAALRDLSSPRALVIRDGAQRRIAGREVVRDDLIILAEGDRVPADATILANVNLQLDESLLTGESVPVRKVVWDEASRVARPGGDSMPFVYSGTLVTGGRALARVHAIGTDTEFGKIGKSLKNIEREDTRLQREIRRLVKFFALWGSFLSAIVVIFYGVSHGWIQGFLAGIALAISLLPEEFPVVLTVFLALGAWRMSRKQVLTRRTQAIEALGAATVLCVDKTGTLTMNRMTVAEISAGENVCDLRGVQPVFTSKCTGLLEYAMLASARDPFDPIEKACKEAAEQFLSGTDRLHKDWELVGEYPLSDHLFAISHVWKSPRGREYVIASKGAPEAITDLCHSTAEGREKIMYLVEDMAARGLRVLGVAKAHIPERSVLPQDQHDFVFSFMGLIGFADPVRPTVAQSVGECYEAGIRVVMITGDYSVTAQNIGKQIGLQNCDKVITGAELESMSEAEFVTRARDTNIFARVVPEQKLRIVEAFKKLGGIVAMTGDGVNDAPALESAHIGVAMGGRGTDVAREAAALVLLDDDFSSIVAAVKMGRRIYNNIKKALCYVFAIHVPIAGLALLSVIFKLPLVLLPLHIVFLELIIDPASSVVFEREPAEEGVMRQPPRPLDKPLFSFRTMVLSVVQGFIVFAVVALVFFVSHYLGKQENDVRSLTFATLVLGNLGLIVANLSWSHSFFSVIYSKNKALWAIIGGTILLLVLVIYVPFFQDLFHLAPLHFFDVILVIAAAVLSIAGFDFLKILRGYKRRG